MIAEEASLPVAFWLPVRILFDTRPAAADQTGIGRNTRTVAELLVGALAAHEVVVDGELLRFTSAIDEELELPARLAREQIDAFHSPLFHVPAVLPGATRVVVTIHDAVPALRPELSTEAFARVWQTVGEATARADAIVCPTEAAKWDVVKALGVPVERVHVVPETPSAVFRPTTHDEQAAARARLGLGDERFLLVLGALEHRKNPTLVLRALRARPALPLAVFVGPAGAIDLHAEAERFGVASRVRILGVLPDADLVALLGATTVLAFPTLAEGFGLPVVEAFATGTPVVASDVPAVREVAGDGATLVPVDDAEALADALARVANEPELADTLRARGRARLEHYSPAAVRAAFTRVYDALEAE